MRQWTYPRFIYVVCGTLGVISFFFFSGVTEDLVESKWRQKIEEESFACKKNEYFSKEERSRERVNPRQKSA
jgi:hypothetical protein